MSRPVGSKNKFGPGNLPGGGLLREVLSLPPVQPIHYDLTMSLRVYRRHEKWPGQWELTKVDNDGKRTTIVDATSRQSVINMVNRQIMKMVIAG